ncbi:MAG: HlyC/CorC family transporter [Chlorobiaceae bacterium]|nr:HlyC/CorC family transporter [Chlorobiaceae bacterium]MBA4308948.1 HlyC/CorC family transporter [Chlorobiaceae bacterium]
MLNDFLLIIILLILSSLISAAEVSFFLSKKIKLEIKAKKENIGAKYALFFLDNPSQFFSTLLIANVFVLVALFALSSTFIFELYHFDQLKIVIILSLFVLFFSILFPKYLAVEVAEKYFIIASPLIKITNYILRPLVVLTKKILNWENFILDNKERVVNSFIKEKSKSGMDDIAGGDDSSRSDQKIISKVFEFKNLRVYDAMRPRTEIIGVEINTNIKEVLNTFIEYEFSKLIVYDENLDNIKGFVFSYDLFNSPKNLNEITREILFIPETKKIVDLLDDLLEKRISIAVVVDEFGGTAGIITVEDIIEELFGEIKDEYDDEEHVCKKISDNTYLINGQVEIDHVNEKFSLDLPIGDYETVAGLLINYLRKIPSKDEIVKVKNYVFQIVRANQVKIELIKLTVEQD